MTGPWILTTGLIGEKEPTTIKDTEATIRKLFPIYNNFFLE